MPGSRSARSRPATRSLEIEENVRPKATRSRSRQWTVLALRREVAQDLPKVLIDGATGGLTVFLMRGTDPDESCVACCYAEVATDDEAIWATRLGVGRDEVKRLKESGVGFPEDVLRSIERNGTYPWDEEVEAGFRTEGGGTSNGSAVVTPSPSASSPERACHTSALCAGS